MKWEEYDVNGNCWMKIPVAIKGIITKISFKFFEVKGCNCKNLKSTVVFIIPNNPTMIRFE